MIVALLAAASLALQQRGLPQRPVPRVGPESARVEGMIIDSERQFFATWQRYWTASEVQRHSSYNHLRDTSITLPRSVEISNPRTRDLKCAFDYDMMMKPREIAVPSDFEWGLDPGKREIGSKENSRHFVCPNWLPPPNYYLTGPNVPDERLDVDNALEPEYQARIEAARSSVIDEIRTALRRFPGDRFLVGQRVRLLLDQRDPVAALDAARECKAEASWCALLEGYAYHRLGDIEAAEGAYDRAFAAFTPRERCAWNDLNVLFDGSDRTDYSRLSCGQRDSANARIWWLADPLWSDPGNDRHVEQVTRQLTNVLHSATGRDERYNWTTTGGGDALAEMILRYGWPSYTSGPGLLRFPLAPPPTWGVSLLYTPRPKGPPIRTQDMIDREIGGVSTTYEYTLGRVHILPPMRMLDDPFAIKNTDWAMNAPAGDPDRSMQWWPREHYAPLHPITRFTDQQIAHLRRQSTTLLAFSTNLSQTDLNRRPADSVGAEFVWSTGPDSMHVSAPKFLGALDRLVFLEEVPLTPSLVSVEVMWDSGGKAAGRSRFGVTPPPPLSAMAPGDVAMSEPVLLAATPDDAAIPSDAELAIPRMLGSTSIHAATNAIGVYWETYGFAATDSVDVTITIQPKSLMGLLRTLGAAAGIASNANAPITVTWSEPQRGHDTQTIAGAVPIQMRSVILNIAALPAGEFSLDVSVAKRSGPTVHSSRDFILK